MEKFIQSEVNKLIKEYIKTKDPLVLSELKQFVDHIPNILSV
jgi:preprotein translocase subunit Sec63